MIDGIGITEDMEENWHLSHKMHGNCEVWKVYVTLVKNSHIHAQVMWTKVAYIIWSMENRKPGVITMIISHGIVSTTSILSHQMNTNNIAKGFSYVIGKGKRYISRWRLRR